MFGANAFAWIYPAGSFVGPGAPLLVDAAVVASTTVVTSNESSQYVESSTISGKTSIASTEGTGTAASDSATITSITFISAILTTPYHDSSTPTSITSIDNSYESFIHPSGEWGAFDTDNGVII